MLRIRDVYPGSRILIFTHPGSRISDPGSRIQKQQQKRGVKKISCHTFFYSHKFNKIVNYFLFEMLNKNIWAKFTRIIELFTQKVSLSSQKYGFGIRDPRSGIRKKPIPDPGPRIQGSKRHRIPDPGSATLVLSMQDGMHQQLRIVSSFALSPSSRSP